MPKVILPLMLGAAILVYGMQPFGDKWTPERNIETVYAGEDMQTENYYKDLRSFAQYLTIVKNAGSKEASASARRGDPPVS